MKFSIVYTRIFEKEFKRLSAKYLSLKADFKKLLVTLENDPLQGSPLVIIVLKYVYQLKARVKVKEAVQE